MPNLSQPKKTRWPEKPDSGGFRRVCRCGSGRLDRVGGINRHSGFALQAGPGADSRFSGFLVIVAIPDIAKAKGARKVFATASTANQQFLRGMGTDVTIDYTRARFKDIAKDVDVVLDTVGRDTLERSYRVMKKRGIVLSIVVDKPDPEALEAHGIRGVMVHSTPKAGVLEELRRLLEAKKLTAVISQTFPMADVVQAQEQIATAIPEERSC